jgi:hypothetical protein
MSSSHRTHFHNDAPRLYFRVPPLTPPEQLKVLTFDNSGDIRMDSPLLDHPSPPIDSDTDNDHKLCLSPPYEDDDVSLGDAPSPPLTSPAVSDGYFRCFASLSPPSPVNGLQLAIPSSKGPGGTNSSEQRLTSSSPPAPSLLLGGSANPPHITPVSPPQQIRPEAGSDQDSDFPTASPPSSLATSPPLVRRDAYRDFPTASPPSSLPTSPLQSRPPYPAPDVVSIASTSPGSSFQWSPIPESLRHHFDIPHGRSVIELASVPFQPPGICINPCCEPRLVNAEAFLAGESAVAMMREIPIPCLSGIQRTVGSWKPRKTYNAVELRHDGRTLRFSPWALTVWHSFVKIHDSITIWKKALELFQTQNDNSTLEILNTICWDAKCPFRDSSLDSIARLATRHWLTDESVAVLVYMVNLNLSETTSHVLGLFTCNAIELVRLPMM